MGDPIEMQSSVQGEAGSGPRIDFCIQGPEAHQLTVHVGLATANLIVDEAIKLAAKEGAVRGRVVAETRHVLAAIPAIVGDELAATLLERVKAKSPQGDS